MIKKYILIFVALLASPSSIAGNFYFETENNTELVGADFKETRTDLHFGYEGNVDTEFFSYYLQVGPSLISEDDTEAMGRLSGKVGINVDVTKKLNFYTDFFILSTDEDNLKKVTLGSKYKF